MYTSANYANKNRIGGYKGNYCQAMRSWQFAERFAQLLCFYCERMRAMKKT